MTAMPAVSTAANRAITLLATVVRVVAAIIGAIILLHAVFVLFEANRSNVLVEFTESVRDTFGWFTKNLFSTDTEKIGEAINDAIAALIYGVVGSFLSKLILRMAPSTKAKA
jgi:uncharacterized membrane protein YeaQ/YmgE (transglycosylase-associated protein family)